MSKLGDLHISPQSQKGFEKLVREMEKTVGAEMPKVVKFAAKDVVFKLVKATPMGNGPTRGFAKAGWGLSMSRLGIRPASFIFQNTAARPALWPMFGSYKDNTNRKESPSIEMTNEVPYIEEMRGSSAVVPIAFHNASTAYEKRLTKLGRKMAGRWAR